MEEQNSNFLKKWINPKILFLILVLVILGEAFFIIKNSKVSILPPPLQAEPIKGGEIILLVSKSELKIGDILNVPIKISTGGHSTKGTDVLIKFDPKYLEASPSSIKVGKTYPRYSLLSVDQKNGLVRISAISLSGKDNFNGMDVLALVIFKAKEKGITKISVEFQKGQTNDSNMIDARTSKDILNKVNNLDLNILP